MMTETTATQSRSDIETSVVTTTEEQLQEVPTLRLRLKKAKNPKSVQWTSGTVDNEFMNKKKSKCCCIFEKRKKPIDEDSDSDDDDEKEHNDDECDHCHGHVEQLANSLTETTVETETITLPSKVNGTQDKSTNNELEPAPSSQ